MKKLKLKDWCEVIIIIFLIFITTKYTIHSLDSNCVSLYIYTEKDLSEIYKDKSIKNLWFIANKIRIMDECKIDNYKNFLNEVKNSKQEVNFSGYDWVSKGTFSLSDLASEKLKNKGIQ